MGVVSEAASPSRSWNASDATEPNAPVFHKPQVDKMDYRFIVLENSLKALLISDPETDKAAAAVDVNAGALQDPADVQGLAHFTEHMLFYSSEKYPVEDEYSKFISDHGGHTNAYTDSENTNYHFDINWNHLEPALDRFAQFFICPLISEDGVDREVKAVDSEHSKNLNTDSWRNHQLLKHTANKDHPWSKFSTGNIDTLSTEPRRRGCNPRDLVVDFHRHHYSANLMRLVVIGREPLDQLQTLVTRAFSAVPNHDLPTPSLPADIFLPEHLCKLVKAVPQKDGHILEVLWPVPPSTPTWRHAPMDYLSHLLGHEGTGSLFALLKAEGWAASLTAGEGTSLSCGAFFVVRVELTEAGQRHVPQVLGLLHRYLEVVRAEGVQEGIWEEMRQLRQLSFTFRDKRAPYSYASSLASCMHDFPDADLLLGSHGVPLEYNEACIRQVLECMVPQRLRIFWSSKQFQGQLPQREPWYSSQYDLQPLPEDWLHLCTQPPTDSRLNLPTANPFIPTDLAMLPPDAATTTPRVVAERPLVRTWHQQEARFPTPKAAVVLELRSPAVYQSPEAAVLSRLLVKLLGDYLSEVTYPAELAGLYFSTQTTTSGVQLAASGYHHRLRTLLDTLLEPLLNFTVKEERFALVKEQLTKEYRNTVYQQPYQWAMYRSDSLLSLRKWRVEEYLEVLPGLQPADLQTFHVQLLSRCFVEALVVGNLPEAAAVQLADDLQAQLAARGARPPFPGQLKELRALQVPAGGTCRFREPGPNPSNENSSVVLLHQIGPDDLQRNALADLVVQLGRRDAFHQLRTVEQLGYMVFLFATRDDAVTAIQFVLQSAAFSAAHLAARVESFLQQQLRAILAGLTQAALDAAVEELAAAKLERPKKLSDVVNRMWSEISVGTLRFRRQEEEVAAMRALTLQQVVDFAQRELINPATRRQLAIHVQGGPRPTPAPAAAAAPAPTATTQAADTAAAAPTATTQAAGTAAAAPTATTQAAGTAPAAPEVTAAGAGGMEQGASVSEAPVPASAVVAAEAEAPVAAAAEAEAPVAAAAEAEVPVAAPAAAEAESPVPAPAAAEAEAPVAAPAAAKAESPVPAPAAAEAETHVAAPAAEGEAPVAAPAAAGAAEAVGRSGDAEQDRGAEAADATEGGAAAGQGAGHLVEIQDMWEFKRSCSVLPAAGAQLRLPAARL